MTDDRDRELVDALEEQLRRQAVEAEREQVEREISGNLTPADDEMIDLREDRLRRKAFEEALKPGDRVRKPDGTTATVLDSPTYYDVAKGDPFTGWAVVVENDYGSKEYGRLERLSLVSE
jgi:hypothetical protein